MEGIGFDESNCVLGPPTGTSEKDCHSLNVYLGCTENGDSCVISCWRPTTLELADIARTGQVWLWIESQSMPPLVVMGHSPFDAERKVEEA